MPSDLFGNSLIFPLPKALPKAPLAFPDKVISLGLIRSLNCTENSYFPLIGPKPIFIFPTYKLFSCTTNLSHPGNIFDNVSGFNNISHVLSGFRLIVVCPIPLIGLFSLIFKFLIEILGFFLFSSFLFDTKYE